MVFVKMIIIIILKLMMILIMNNPTTAAIFIFVRSLRCPLDEATAGGDLNSIEHPI